MKDFLHILSSGFPKGFSKDIKDAIKLANAPSASNTFITYNDMILWGAFSGNVNTYADLPDATLSNGKFYWVINNQGAQWLPGSLGGAYYPRGIYYSTGTEWITVDSPVNATQLEVDTGLVDNKFVSPKTLKDWTGNRSPELTLKGRIYGDGNTDNVTINNLGNIITADYNNLQNIPTTFLPSVHTHTVSDIANLQSALDDKQDILVSGTNIKTINGSSVLGSGDLTISAGIGDMLKSENLSGLNNYTTARANLGLGTLATQSGVFTDKEDVSNKSTSINTDQSSNTKYPSTKAVYDWAIGLFATISNLNLKANIDSPTFTGIPTLPTGTIAVTQTAGDNTTAVATTAHVFAERNNIVTLTNKRITQRVTSETSSATPTINADNTDIHRITALAVNIIGFTISGTPTHGQSLIIEITGTAARAIERGVSFEASTIALPTTTVGTDILTVGFKWNSATSKRRCLASA